MEEQIKTIQSRIKYHQGELNKALDELLKLVENKPNELEVPKITLRERVKTILEDGVLRTAREIKLELIRRGCPAMNVDQGLVNMEKDGIIESDRTGSRKRYFLRKISQ